MQRVDVRADGTSGDEQEGKSSAPIADEVHLFTTVYVQRSKAVHYQTQKSALQLHSCTHGPA